MKRVAFIGLALLLVGAIIVLTRAMLSDSQPAISSPPRSDDPTSLRDSSEEDNSATPPVRPTLPRRDGDALPSDSSEAAYREYVRADGTLVRDHRAGDREPSDFAPSPVRPPGAQSVEPEAILSVRNAMRPIVHKCAEELNPEQLGPKPRLQGRVTISILDGNLSVDSADIQVRDVPEEDVDAVVDCIKHPLEQQLLPAKGHREVSEYVITLPFRLRR